MKDVYVMGDMKDEGYERCLCDEGYERCLCDEGYERWEI